MRSLASGERALLAGTPLSVKGQVQVRDSDGTWRDVSNLGGYDFFDSAEWGGNPDDPVQSCTITLLRQASSVNISPLMGSSSINRDAGASYVPFLQENRRIRLYTAEGLPGFTPGSNANNSWHLVFDGKIDDVVVNKSNIVLSCRDLGAFLQQASIEVETIYGTDPAPGMSLEAIMQAIITQWVPNPPTMVVPVASGAYRTRTKKADGSLLLIPLGNVMDALQSLAAEIGWVCRYEWGAGDTYELRFYRPGLRGGDDTTFDYTEYTSSEYKTSDSDIRNVIRATSIGALSAPITYTSSDATSIAIYGRRFGHLQLEGTSGVDTPAELQVLADAAVADLSTPYASHTIETTYFWPVERGDRHGYLANNSLYDSGQTLYVTSFKHSLSGGKGKTTIDARGKPLARFRSWMEVFGAEALSPNSILDVVATEFATTYSIAWGGTGVISLSIDGGAWITQPSAPLNASPIVVARNPENGATKIYRFRTVLGLDITYENIYVLPIGAVAPPPDLSVVPSTPATLTQAYTVTCLNPRAGGATPTITVFSVGASGTVALFGGGTATVTDGASPITVPSGSVVTMTRPAFMTPAGNVIFRGIISGGGLAEIQRTVVSRQAIGPNLTVTPTPYTSTYSVAWTGDGVTLSIDGGAYATPGASPIIVNRSAVNGPDKVYTFKGTLDGQTVTNTVTIPAVGAPETPNLTVTCTGTSDTQMTFVVTAASPSGGGVPTILGYLTDATFASIHSNGGSITSGDTVIINRPAFASKRDGMYRVRATANGGTAYEEITWNIAPQVQTSFGPSLTITPISFATTYSLYWSGDSVQVDKSDGNGFVAPSTSPMIVNRPSVGSADLVYTFRGTKDGQEVTNSITITAQGTPDTPNLNVTPTASSTQQSFYCTMTAASGTPVGVVYLTGASFASSHYSGGPFNSGDTIIVDKPTFGNQAGSIRILATLNGKKEEISRTIVTQIKTSFGPSMQLRTHTTATQYTIYWDDNGSGATIEANIDAAGWGAPSASPWNVDRPSVGSNDLVIVFRAIKDDQYISDTIVIPAIGKTAPTLDLSVTEYDTTVSISWNGTGSTTTYYKDGSGPYTPGSNPGGVAGTNPLIITRNAVGGATINITLRVERDGANLTNTVIVNPITPLVLTATVYPRLIYWNAAWLGYLVIIPIDPFPPGGATTDLFIEVNGPAFSGGYWSGYNYSGNSQLVYYTIPAYGQTGGRNYDVTITKSGRQTFHAGGLIEGYAPP